MRKPFFKKSHKCWYVNCQKTGKPIRLDPDERKAYDMFSRMLDANSPITPSVSFTRLAEEYLADNYQDGREFANNARHIVSFADFIGLKRAVDVTKQDIVKWLNEDKPGQKRKNDKGEMVDGPTIKWSDRSKQVAYSAIKKVYSWAIDGGHIPKNPIKKIALKPPKPRCSVISEEDHAKLIEAADPAFKLYLTAATCGARPQQIREVTAAHVLPDFSAWVFVNHKTEWKTAKPLVVYLTPDLQELTKQLIAKYPSGPLFRNSQGQPWKKDTVTRKMKRLTTKLGLPEDTVVYSYRHTFTTNALMQDVPIQTVSELLGHKDTRMVSHVYGHLDKHRKYLLEAVKKAQGQS